METLSIPVSDSTEFDCLSPVFNTITFHRLRLRRGETKEIEVVYIFPVSTEASFQTRMLKQRYRRLSDESVIGARGPVSILQTLSLHEPRIGLDKQHLDG